MPRLTTTPKTRPAEVTPKAELEVIRHSELADFRQCPLKWWLKWYHSYQATSSLASSLGTAWHDVMAAHYGEVFRLQQQGLQASVTDCRAVVSKTIGHYRETPHYDQLVWMYDGYLEFWMTDDGWDIIEYETTQTVEILPGIQYEWTTDLLVYDRRLHKQRLVDHKSTKNALRKTDVDLSDQLGLYIKAQTLRGQKVADGVVNQVRTEKLKRPMTLEERNARLPSYRSPVELDNIWEDARRTARKILEYRQSGEIPYSAPDPRTCDWKCEYKETHLILRKTPESKWGSRVGSLLRMKGLSQGEVPRGSDRPQHG